MKKVLPKKARILIASSLVVVFLAVVVLSVSLVFSSITYSQKVGTQFNMSYEAPVPSYPQTYVGDTLNTTLEGLISSSSSSLVATGKKYTTDANGTTKECLEYRYGGQKYARLVGAVPRNTSTEWLNSTINTYNLTTQTITSGNNYWFKVEPIEFDTFTLSSVETVKISKMILGSHAIDSSRSGWSTSSLKTYLNGTFLEESGLSDIAQNRTYYSTTYSNYTTLSSNSTQVTSKIWLPSNGEIQEMYGTADINGLNTAIRKVATDFARATYTWVIASPSNAYMKDINGTSENCSTFWLRSFYNDDMNNAWYVYGDGIIHYYYYFGNHYGFAPAFVV